MKPMMPVPIVAIRIRSLGPAGFGRLDGRLELVDVVGHCRGGDRRRGGGRGHRLQERPTRVE